jgi:hypothetical protein
MAHGNKICECGLPATRRHGNASVCEFCYWCETQLSKGGEVRRRVEPSPRPVVKRIPEWNEVREAVLALHGCQNFWAQRNSPRERFNALFRRQSAAGQPVSV